MDAQDLEGFSSSSTARTPCGERPIVTSTWAITIFDTILKRRMRRSEGESFDQDAPFSFPARTMACLRVEESCGTATASRNSAGELKKVCEETWRFCLESCAPLLSVRFKERLDLVPAFFRDNGRLLASVHRTTVGDL